MSENENSHVTQASMASIAMGEFLSHCDFQLQKAIENCLDPNTEAKAVRTINIKIQLKPNQNRSAAELMFSVDTKLPSDSVGIDQVFLRSDGKGFVSKAEQLTFEQSLTDASKLVSMNGAKNGLNI